MISMAGERNDFTDARQDYLGNTRFFRMAAPSGHMILNVSVDTAPLMDTASGTTACRIVAASWASAGIMEQVLALFLNGYTMQFSNDTGFFVVSITWEDIDATSTEPPVLEAPSTECQGLKCLMDSKHATVLAVVGGACAMMAAMACMWACCCVPRTNAPPTVV